MGSQKNSTSTGILQGYVGGHYKFLYHRLSMSEFFRLAICADYLATHVFHHEFQSFFQHKYWNYLANQTNGAKLSISEMEALDWLLTWRDGGEPYSMEIATKCGAPYCQCARLISQSTTFCTIIIMLCVRAIRRQSRFPFKKNKTLSKVRFWPPVCQTPGFIKYYQGSTTYMLPFFITISSNFPVSQG